MRFVKAASEQLQKRALYPFEDRKGILRGGHTYVAEVCGLEIVFLGLLGCASNPGNVD